VKQLASGPAVLNGFPSSNQQAVQGYLKTMKVDLRLNAKVKTSNETAQGQTDITLEGGEKILADFVIPTYGVIPNTSFVPTEFLNQKGYINVDGHLRLQGLKNVYAIGEVSAFEPAQFMALEGQSTYMAKTLQQILAGTTPAPYKKPSLSRYIPFAMTRSCTDSVIRRNASCFGQQEARRGPHVRLRFP
jgi:NADH dehydrogenase FAD-containing subunit